MRTLRLGTAPLAAAWLLAASAAPAQNPPAAAKIDEYLSAWEKQGRFSGSVLVAKGGQILLSKGYGLANIEHDIPNKPNTKHRLGSITKQFTAVAILQLAEQGKLQLDDPVSKYLPDAPTAWAPITIHHLLTHTSGLKNYTSLPDYFARMRERSTPEQLIARFKDKPLDFEPGSKYSYSNSGYVLLGYIIERASGMKYADYLEKHIFAPADMQDSGVDNDQQILKNRATGYSVGANGKLANAAWIDMTIPYAAGALYSTVEDLYRWDRALTGEKLLSAKSKELMYTPFKDGYAYGWMVQQAGGRKMIGHGGGVNGFATMIARYPEEDVCIVVLGNAERSPSGRLAADIAKILFGGSVPLPQERKEISMTVEQLDRYVGKYDMGPLKFEIKREGTNLIAYPSGQPPTRLAPMAEHRFFVTVVDAEFTFVMGDGGKAKELILHQGGRDMPAKRVE